MIEEGVIFMLGGTVENLIITIILTDLKIIILRSFHYPAPSYC